MDSKLFTRCALGVVLFSIITGAAGSAADSPSSRKKLSRKPTSSDEVEEITDPQPYELSALMSRTEIGKIPPIDAKAPRYTAVVFEHARGAPTDPRAFYLAFQDFGKDTVAFDLEEWGTGLTRATIDAKSKAVRLEWAIAGKAKRRCIEVAYDWTDAVSGDSALRPLRRDVRKKSVACAGASTAIPRPDGGIPVRGPASVSRKPGSDPGEDAELGALPGINQLANVMAIGKAGAIPPTDPKAKGYTAAVAETYVSPTAATREFVLVFQSAMASAWLGFDLSEWGEKLLAASVDPKEKLIRLALSVTTGGQPGKKRCLEVRYEWAPPFGALPGMLRQRLEKKAVACAGETATTPPADVIQD